MEVHSKEEEERSEEGCVGVVWGEGWVDKGHSPGSCLGFLCPCSPGWNELRGSCRHGCSHPKSQPVILLPRSPAITGYEEEGGLEFEANLGRTDLTSKPNKCKVLEENVPAMPTWLSGNPQGFLRTE